MPSSNSRPLLRLVLLFLTRFAGSPENYKLDTLNLYEKDYFMGEEQYISGDSPVLKIASFVR